MRHYLVKDLIREGVEVERALLSRKAYFIDGIKHPAEVEFLRSIFGSSFFLVAVVANDKVRSERLRERKGISEEEFSILSEADSNNGDDAGQQTVKVATEADYFFVNTYSTKDKISSEAERVLRMIFNIGMETPRRGEEGMNFAFKAAVRSACLSRQVGAAIMDSQGHILATGCNDVPMFGGGLYSTESPEDRRCWARGDKCYNDAEKRLIASQLRKDIVEVFQEHNKKVAEHRTRQPAHASSQTLSVVPNDAIDSREIKEPDEDQLVLIKRAIDRSRIRGLIEFSRAVHAEMDAIVSIARTGRSGLQGAILYSTTYPCHNCAKHIIASGITRVVYLEPYEKSLATKLHEDAIVNGRPTERIETRIPFELYEGVAPRRFDMLFTASKPRKNKEGRFVDSDRERRKTSPRIGQRLATLKDRFHDLHQHQ